MKDQKQKKQDKSKSGFSPVAAAVTGAIVGAGVVVAGAVALNDEKNRNKVKEVITNVKGKAMGYVDDIKQIAQDEKDDVEEKIAESKMKVKKLTAVAKEPLDQEVDAEIKVGHMK